MPRDGNTFSPRTGAELLEAADTVSNEGRTSPTYKAVIQLNDADYAVSRTVEVVTAFPVAVRGPETGRARITNSGSPITLLRYSSGQAPAADAGVSGIDFTLKGSSTNTVVAIDLQRGSALRDSSVTVLSATPTTLAKATGVRLSPALGTAATASTASIDGVQVTSAAGEAPAVRVTNGGRIANATIAGGAPPVEVSGDASGTDLGEAVLDASTVRTQGTAASVPVVRVRGGGNRLRPVIWSTVVDGSAGAASLIDVTGPSASGGSIEGELGQLSLRGVGSSIGLRVAPGAAASPSRLAVRGLLALGSQLAVSCSGAAGATTTITVVGVYRTGSNTRGTGCDFVESELRTGALAWRDEAAGDLHPVWDSPLVDAVPDFNVPAVVGQRDRAGGARFVQVRNGASPGDIGALEYQLTPPENVSADFLTLGNRGLTALIGDGTDPDELEASRLEFAWTLPDGTTFDSPVALVRFPTTDPVQVKFTVTDVTGATVFRTITVQPAIRLDEPATDSNDPENPIDPGPLEPEDPGGEEPAPFFPQVITGGSEAPPAVPAIDPSLKQEYPPILKTVRATKRRVLMWRRTQPQYATARRGEAEIVIETWRKSEMALEVTPILEGTGVATGLPIATMPLKPFKGRKTLRIGGKVGKRVLRPGLYQMTIAATPRPGAVPERQSFLVRVLRN